MSFEKPDRLTAVCTAWISLALFLSACEGGAATEDRAPTRGSPTIENGRYGVVRAVRGPIERPPPLRIKRPRKLARIDPNWPSRVANVVGFAPPGTSTNYTARFMSRPSGRAVGETEFVVRRLDDWVRIDEHHEDVTGSVFINLTTELVVGAGGDGRPGHPRFLTITPLTDKPWHGRGRLLFMRKGGVRQADVLPPANAFTLEAWTAGIAPKSDAPGYEVLLQSDDGSNPRSVIERRRGSLIYRETFSASQREFQVTDDAQGLNFSASYTADGRLVGLSVRSETFRRAEPAFESAGETILGEACRWVDNAKYVSDYFSKSCLAKDGAPLMTISGGWGRLTRSTAAEISRKPLPLTALLPPQEALISLRP